MIAFHSCEYDNVEGAKKYGALYKTSSTLEFSYTNLYDYCEVIHTFAKCMGLESGEYITYWVDGDSYTEINEKIVQIGA